MNAAIRAVLRLSTRAVVLSLMLAATAAEAEDPTLGKTHAAADITCPACHGEAAPLANVDSTVCTRCHGDANALAVKTQTLAPNPHLSPHLPEGQSQPCVECHHVHRAQELTCAACHKTFKNFQFRLQRRSRGGTTQ